MPIQHPFLHGVGRLIQLDRETGGNRRHRDFTFPEKCEAPGRGGGRLPTGPSTAKSSQVKSRPPQVPPVAGIWTDKSYRKLCASSELGLARPTLSSQEGLLACS
jgi:hypothetical protein